jgi:hypothetical protein
MSDSRENPALWRFPVVSAVGRCTGLGPGQRCDAPTYQRGGEVVADRPAGALVGWADAPDSGVGGATIDHVSALLKDVTTVQPSIATDRHSRGGGALDTTVVRGAELATGLTVHRARNYEVRFPSECSRQLAHAESRKEYDAWKLRRADDCSACSAPQ